MCGIAGFFAKKGAEIDFDALERMASVIAHRGPDGAGAFDARGVALRHRRLSIVDVQGGGQPLRDGDVTLVANGEIYNDLALRAQMPQVTFHSGSDCEVPLHLWRTMGVAFAGALRGMFAIALVDQHASSDHAVLARDPFGIKPLYYVETQSGLAFASEARALIVGGYAEARCAPDSVVQLLQCQFTTGRKTIYPRVNRVMPGETLAIQDGLVTRRHQKAPIAFNARSSLSEGQALAAFDQVFCESVRVHQRADVPCGLFLSGGIDSTAILAAMARLDVSRPVAWTARFDAGPVDEASTAKAAANAFNASHEVLTITQEMFWRDLPRIIAAMDDPVADYAIIPTWFLAQAAKRDLKVVLSGEGGDELFGGYGRYRRAQRTRWLGGRAPWSKGIFDGILEKGADACWKDAFRLPSGGDQFSAAQALDLATWLPDDLLVKLDRCLMVHGVEGRTPFLDPEVAECAATLPTRLKIRHGRGKYLLRKWLSTQTDAIDAFAPKQGFTVPVGDWIAGQGARLGGLMADCTLLQKSLPGLNIMSIMQGAGARNMRRAAWTLLFFTVWHKIHIEKRASDGDVWDVLSARH